MFCSFARGEKECPAPRALQPARVEPPAAGQEQGVPGESFVPFPETPKLVEARILAHPAGGRDCLLATTEDGRRLAFGFEAESDRPGLEIVDPRLWLEAAGEPEDSPRVFDAVKEINADDWLQAVVTNPVGNEWLEGIKAKHPQAFGTWFSQRQYESGGEEGSG
jgi:hypothetical protein